jgi:hypothetical protein
LSEPRLAGLKEDYSLHHKNMGGRHVVFRDTVFWEFGRYC